MRPSCLKRRVGAGRSCDKGAIGTPVLSHPPLQYHSSCFSGKAQIPPNMQPAERQTPRGTRSLPEEPSMLHLASEAAQEEAALGGSLRSFRAGFEVGTFLPQSQEPAWHFPRIGELTEPLALAHHTGLPERDAALRKTGNSAGTPSQSSLNSEHLLTCSGACAANKQTNSLGAHLDTCSGQSSPVEAATSCGLLEALNRALSQTCTASDIG